MIGSGADQLLELAVGHIVSLAPTLDIQIGLQQLGQRSRRGKLDAKAHRLRGRRRGDEHEQQQCAEIALHKAEAGGWQSSLLRYVPKGATEPTFRLTGHRVTLGGARGEASGDMRTPYRT